MLKTDAIEQLIRDGKLAKMNDNPPTFFAPSRSGTATLAGQQLADLMAEVERLQGDLDRANNTIVDWRSAVERRTADGLALRKTLADETKARITAQTLTAAATTENARLQTQLAAKQEPPTGRCQPIEEILQELPDPDSLVAVAVKHQGTRRSCLEISYQGKEMCVIGLDDIEENEADILVSAGELIPRSLLVAMHQRAEAAEACLEKALNRLTDAEARVKELEGRSQPGELAAVVEKLSIKNAAYCLVIGQGGGTFYSPKADGNWQACDLLREARDRIQQQEAKP